MRFIVGLLALAGLINAEFPPIKLPSGIQPVKDGLSGTAKTTHYWDCCKPACGWRRTNVVNAVRSCEKDGETEYAESWQSGICQGGEAYACSKQHAFAVNNTFAMGLSSVYLGGLNIPDQMDMCCTCFLLQFQGLSTAKQMVVQMINSGDDYQKDAVTFDLTIPGGGVGYYNGCTDQWGAPPDGWGKRYGGVSSREECQQLPAQLRDYCPFRFDFLEGIDNPHADFVQVECPAEIVALTQCTRSD